MINCLVKFISHSKNEKNQYSTVNVCRNRKWYNFCLKTLYISRNEIIRFNCNKNLKELKCIFNKCQIYRTKKTFNAFLKHVGFLYNKTTMTCIFEINLSHTHSSGQLERFFNIGTFNSVFMTSIVCNTKPQMFYFFSLDNCF